MEAKRAEEALKELAQFRAFNEAYCSARSSKRGAAKRYIDSLEEVILCPKPPDSSCLMEEMRKSGIKIGT